MIIAHGGQDVLIPIAIILVLGGFAVASIVVAGILLFSKAIHSKRSKTIALGAVLVAVICLLLSALTFVNSNL